MCALRSASPGRVDGLAKVKGTALYGDDITLPDMLYGVCRYADIPAGYELHHIVPLSEGGADDVHNLLLVSEFDHQQITDAQRAFYGW